MKTQTLVKQIVQGMQERARPSDYWRSSRIDFPELEVARLIIQRNNQSVRDHTMAVIDNLEIKNSITLLSGLFHDLGKCVVVPQDHPSGHRFPEHDAVSARIAKETLIKWEAPLYLIDRVTRIISMHMYDIANVTKEKTIRKFVAGVGNDNVNNWFTLRIADSRSYSNQIQYVNHFIKPFQIMVMEYLDKQPNLDDQKRVIDDQVSSIQIKGEDA